MCFNILEQIVADVLEENWNELRLPCSCESCKEDVLVHALNALPPQYVTQNKGRLFQKVNLMQEQSVADILQELARAAGLVKQQPRHPIGENSNV